MLPEVIAGNTEYFPEHLLRLAACLGVVTTAVIGVNQDPGVAYPVNVCMSEGIGRKP
jgi:hypothetical protein